MCYTHDASPQWAKCRNARPKWAAAAALSRKVGAFLDGRCLSPRCHVQTRLFHSDVVYGQIGAVDVGQEQSV